MARVLVAGGTGNVGEGIVEVLLGNGHEVVVPSRSRESLDALGERLGSPGGLVGVEGDIASYPQTVLEGAGDIDHAVISVGRWWSGPKAVDTPPEEWDAVQAMGIGAHLSIARAVVPVIEGTGGCYVMINGGGAIDPVPGSAAVSVSAAAQLMLARALAAEHDDLVVCALVLMTPVITRDRPNGRPGWITATDAGRTVASILDGSTIPRDGVVRLPE